MTAKAVRALCEVIAKHAAYMEDDSQTYPEHIHEAITAAKMALDALTTEEE